MVCVSYVWHICQRNCVAWVWHADTKVVVIIQDDVRVADLQAEIQDLRIKLAHAKGMNMALHDSGKILVESLVNAAHGEPVDLEQIQRQLAIMMMPGQEKK